MKVDFVSICASARSIAEKMSREENDMGVVLIDDFPGFGICLKASSEAAKIEEEIFYLRIDKTGDSVDICSFSVGTVGVI